MLEYIGSVTVLQASPILKMKMKIMYMYYSSLLFIM